MKLATLAAAGRDGQLVVVSRDLRYALSAASVAPTLQAALDDWDLVEPALRKLAALLEIDTSKGMPFDPLGAQAPLPRAWQWLDGSAFPAHGELMAQAFGIKAVSDGRPLMYQGLSHQFLGPAADVPLPSEADGIDFEGEFAVIVGAVPMGTSAREALDCIRLVVQINDWSLRAIAPLEMKTGFGWLQSKPACSVAAVAVTPDELDVAWSRGRVGLPLHVELNGQPFGRANGGEMAFGFHELVAHAARTRSLCAGTIVGSGTIANSDYAAVGSSCITECRMIETIRYGAPRTPFMRFGDRVRMEAREPNGTPLFGPIDQQVVSLASKDRRAS
jgi:fumarylacetoacetate (FAA) hydrolase